MQLLLTTKWHFTIALWMPVRLSAATPASLNGCGSHWWDVSRRALNLMEDILSTYYKYTLSAVSHKLNVSGHLFILWRVDQLLGKHLETSNEVSDPFLSNSSVNTFQRKGETHNNTITMETRVFSMWSLPRSYKEDDLESIAAGYGLDVLRSNSGNAKFFSSPQCPNRLSSPPSLLSNEYRERFLRE
jgi:hypothetical protein